MSGGLSPDNKAVIITGRTPISRSTLLSSMLFIDAGINIIDFESGQPKQVDYMPKHDYMYANSSAPAPYNAPANVKAVRAARKAKKKARKVSRRK
jgi:hypothetical protein